MVDCKKLSHTLKLGRTIANLAGRGNPLRASQTESENQSTADADCNDLVT